MSKYEDAKETQNDEEDPRDLPNRNSGKQKVSSKEKHEQPVKQPENKEKKEPEKVGHDEVNMIEITDAVLFGNPNEEAEKQAKEPKIPQEMETQKEKPQKVKKQNLEAKKSQEANKFEVQPVKELRTVKEARTTKERKEKKTLEGKEDVLVAVKEKDSGKDQKAKKDSKRSRTNRGSKEMVSVRTKREPKSKQHGSGETIATPKAEPQTTRQKKFRKSASQLEPDVQTAREKKPKKRSAEKIKEPTPTAPKTCREKKEEETASARERRKEKKRQKRAEEDAKAAALHNYVPVESETERKRMEALPPICNDRFGYGKGFPNWLLEVPRTVSVRIEPGNPIPVVMIYPTMIIYGVPPEFQGNMDVGDILYQFNGITLKSRQQYVDSLTELRKNLNQTETLTWTFYRTVRVRQVDARAAEQLVPQGFEVIPLAFDYLYCYLYVISKATLGMNIKSFNGKVFVSAIDNGKFSMARKCLMVGDAILKAEEMVLTDINSANAAFNKYLAESNNVASKKYMTLLVERARNGSGLKPVKLALSIEKKPEINPRMNTDVAELCSVQLEHMQENPNEMPTKSILKTRGAKKTKKRIEVAPESVEAQIGTEYNPQLLMPTPALPTAYASEGGVYASGKTVMLAKPAQPPQTLPKMI